MATLEHSPLSCAAMACVAASAVHREQRRKSFPHPPPEPPSSTTKPSSWLGRCFVGLVIYVVTEQLVALRSYPRGVAVLCQS